MSRSFVKTILPIDAHIPAIVEAVECSSVAIVNGSAGSGKSTRILPALLDHLSADWRIYQTEPRPALVRSAALRILDEHRHLGWCPGLPVGYIAGSERHVLPASRAIILNDQSLVNLFSANEISEPTLVIVDEAHVRSTQNDVLLGMLNLMLKINPESLRVVISSATAHVEAFEKFFGKAEVITIAGRQFPVTRRVFSSEDSVVSIADQLCDDVANFLQGTYTIDAPEFPQVTPSYGAVAAVLPGEDDVEYVAEEIRDSLLRDPEATVEQIPGGELIMTREKSVEILKDYRAFEDRIDAEARMRTDVPDDCLRVIVGTEIVRTGLTMKDLHEFHDCGLVKRLCDDHGVGKLETQFISQAEVVQAEGRVGRLLPGRYNLYLPHNKNITDLVSYPESELHKQPLTRTVLAIRSAGYDPETFPFIDQVVEDANGLDKSFGERLKQADHRLRNLGMITVEGSVTRLGQKMRSIKARPELAVSVWRGEDLGVLPEVLLAGAMIESGNNPFLHTKKELRFAPFETCEEVVRILLAHCRCTDDGLGQVRAFYTRDLMVTEPERVSLERLPVWIRRDDQGLFTIDLVAEDGRVYLTDRGRQELSLLVRRSFSQGSGSDFVAMVRACRAFAAARKQLKDEDAPRLASMSEEEIEEAVRTRRHRLKQWCEHRFLNFSNLQAAWRQIGDLMSDVKRAGTVVPKDVAASRTFSAEHLLEALIPLLEQQIAVKLGAGTTYTIGSHLVEPSWQSVLREFYPLPQFALFADIRRGERRGEEHFFAEYAAPLELDRLLKLQPARWKIIAQPSNISTPRHVIEDVVLLDARRNQEVCRFRRERPHIQ